MPRVPSASVSNIALALIGDRPVGIETTGTRPGQKLHEVLVSEEEVARTISRGGHYVIAPMLPELRNHQNEPRGLTKEYSSADDVMDLRQTAALLRRHRLMLDDVAADAGELIR